MPEGGAAAVVAVACMRTAATATCSPDGGAPFALFFSRRCLHRHLLHTLHAGVGEGQIQHQPAGRVSVRREGRKALRAAMKSARGHTVRAAHWHARCARLKCVSPASARRRGCGDRDGGATARKSCNGTRSSRAPAFREGRGASSLCSRGQCERSRVACEACGAGFAGQTRRPSPRLPPNAEAMPPRASRAGVWRSHHTPGASASASRGGHPPAP